MPKRDVPLSYGFVDLAQEKRPKSGTPYPVVSASGQFIESIPFEKPKTDEPVYAISLQVLSLWIQGLPDLTRQNEAMLKIGGRTRRYDNPKEIINLSSTLDFQVRDKHVADVNF